jgi:hypothetical protein
MKTNNDIENFKKYLKTLSLDALVEIKEESDVFMPNYELRMKLIENEIVVKNEQIKKLEKKLQKLNIEIALLRADIRYNFNEN